MTQHIMIDLETMSTTPNAAIVQIGAVLFDPLGPPIPIPNGGLSDYPGYFWNVDLGSCQKVGLGIDGDTVRWWLEQPKEAQQALLDPDPISLATALTALSHVVWWPDGSEVGWDDCRMWSHGSTFDCVILDQAYRAVGKRTPWHFRNVRDTRTLFELADPDQKIPWEDGGIKHHALWDAWRQAIKVQKCYQLLCTRVEVIGDTSL
mgnify:CR=1 FL=1